VCRAGAQDTTGCLVVARTHEAAVRLAAYFRGREWVRKEVGCGQRARRAPTRARADRPSRPVDVREPAWQYWAFVVGTPKQRQGVYVAARGRAVRPVRRVRPRRGGAERDRPWSARLGRGAGSARIDAPLKRIRIGVTDDRMVLATPEDVEAQRPCCARARAAGRP